MYDFYIDDTERGFLKDRDYIPILGGFIIGRDKYQDVRIGLQELKQSFGLNKFAPIKWSPGKNDMSYQEQRNLSDQNQFREAVLNKINEQDITIIVSIIDVKGLFKRRKYEYYRIQALEQLSQRFQLFLQDMNALKEDSGQIILDHPGGIESKLSRHYREICCNGCSYIDMELPYLSKTLYLAHSFACEGLQIADYIVGVIGYTIKSEDIKYFNLIKDRIRNLNGNTKGLGIIIFPSNSTSVDFFFNVNH